MCLLCRGTSLPAVWCSMLAEVSGAGLNSVSDKMDVPLKTCFTGPFLCGQSSKRTHGLRRFLKLFELRARVVCCAQLVAVTLKLAQTAAHSLLQAAKNQPSAH